MILFRRERGGGVDLMYSLFSQARKAFVRCKLLLNLISVNNVNFIRCNILFLAVDKNLRNEFQKDDLNNLILWLS